MSLTTDMLKRAQQCVPRQSIDGLARAIGADRSNMRKYLKGTAYPNGMHAIEIAKLLKMDVAEVLAVIAADKARTPESAAKARMKIPRLSPATVVAFALIAGMSGRDVRAGTALDFPDNPAVLAIHYAK